MDSIAIHEHSVPLIGQSLTSLLRVRIVSPKSYSQLASLRLLIWPLLRLGPPMRSELDCPQRTFKVLQCLRRPVLASYQSYQASQRAQSSLIIAKLLRGESVSRRTQSVHSTLRDGLPACERARQAQAHPMLPHLSCQSAHSGAMRIRTSAKAKPQTIQRCSRPPGHVAEAWAAPLC